MELPGSQPPLVPERHFVSMRFLPETGHGGRAAPQTMVARCSRVFHVNDDGRHSIPERHQAITGWWKLPVGSEEARSRASLRPPLKLYVPISGIQLSRRRPRAGVRFKRRY